MRRQSSKPIVTATFEETGWVTVKIAVSGKGGVGKTTVSAGLVRHFLAAGYEVYAVDADPDVSLGTVLGLPGEMVDGLAPVVEMREAIAAASGGQGAFVTLNPRVDDLLERYSVRQGNLHFLKMGAVKQGGSSCYCRENSVLNALVNALVLERQEVVVLDMGAGIEHLTRGTARGVDAMLVVSEPTRVSLQTARVVERLAKDLGIRRVRFVLNKVRTEREREFVLSRLAPEEIAGWLPFSTDVLDGALDPGSPLPEALAAEIGHIAEGLQREAGEA